MNALTANAPAVTSRRAQLKPCRERCGNRSVAIAGVRRAGVRSDRAARGGRVPGEVGTGEAVLGVFALDVARAVVERECVQRPTIELHLGRAIGAGYRAE